MTQLIEYDRHRNQFVITRGPQIQPNAMPIIQNFLYQINSIPYNNRNKEITDVSKRFSKQACCESICCFILVFFAFILIIPFCLCLFCPIPGRKRYLETVEVHNIKSLISQFEYQISPYYQLKTNSKQKVRFEELWFELKPKNMKNDYEPVYNHNNFDNRL